MNPAPQAKGVLNVDKSKNFNFYFNVFSWSVKNTPKKIIVYGSIKRPPNPKEIGANILYAVNV